MVTLTVPLAVVKADMSSASKGCMSGRTSRECPLLVFLLIMVLENTRFIPQKTNYGEVSDFQMSS